MIGMKIQRKKLTLVGLLATHGHFDHVLAVSTIQQSFDLPLSINEKDLFLLKKINESAQYFLGRNPNCLPVKKVRFIKERFLKIKKWKLKIIKTPGHTPGSVCFYFPDEKLVFTGDTLFKDGIGRYDFSYSNKLDLDKSLKRIICLSEETIVYPGHGEETTIKQSRVFLGH